MMRRTNYKSPTILVVTPEITYLPEGMGNMANVLHAKAGGLADVSASLVGALFRQGADVHVALPHYRKMFHVDVGKLISDELRVYMSHLHNSRIHLAEDRIFYYRDSVYSSYSKDSFLQAMAFQREVINNIIPGTRKPDLIHCNDWMTGLIPAAARRMGIPCLFQRRTIDTHKATLAQIEDRGIDAAPFWQYLYYERPPLNYAGKPVEQSGSTCSPPEFSPRTSSIRSVRPSSRRSWRDVTRSCRTTSRGEMARQVLSPAAPRAP